MKTFVWGDNQVVTLAENLEEARINALIRLKEHPKLSDTVAKTDPVEVKENTTRILYTCWPGA